MKSAKNRVKIALMIFALGLVPNTRAYAEGMAIVNTAITTGMTYKGLTTIIGEENLAKCTPYTGANCAIAGAAFVGAASYYTMTKDAEKSREDIVAPEIPGISTGAPVANTPPPPPPGTNVNTSSVGVRALGEMGAGLDELKNQMQKKGFSFNKDGSVKMPNGKTITPNQANAILGGDMSSLGLSAAEQAKISEELKNSKGKAKAQLAKIIGDGSGDGGGRRAFGAGDSDPSFELRMPKDPKAGRGQVNVSGMSKKFGNDNIGVAGDNIFEMITRRYKARDATFIK